MKGDTYKETDTRSGLPRGGCPDPGAPDDRGFGAGIPDHDFATGPVTHRGGTAYTRYAEPTYGVGLEGGVGVDA